MNSVSNYFAISEKDQTWGLHLFDCGISRIPAGGQYPSLNHPEKYLFNWERGRILHEYQLIYLIKGEGIFESKESGSIPLVQGSIILIYPDCWHRYKPIPNTDWLTYWVGFDGKFCLDLIPKLNLTPASPVRAIGYQEKIVGVFLDIMETSHFQFSGYQQVLAGEVLKLMGWIHAIQRRAVFKEKNVDKIIQMAKSMMMENIWTIKMEEIAAELNISYSKFRKLFKDYTGLAPGQFLMQHKIAFACNLLNEGNLSIKEVAIKLGFETPQYFSRIFKKKMGMAPGEYQKRMLLKDI
ncbi:AraC family transcriptional regulator [Flexithrix dorotheae]|uniref:AraC family transcriptional regulator n=1 Tax=Flexithrix dorotheae TaxID=70993 RepID=UPI000363390E|nr:AraC family transcriptional regulator [Flexithrix dorotheae]